MKLMNHAVCLKTKTGVHRRVQKLFVIVNIAHVEFRNYGNLSRCMDEATEMTHGNNIREFCAMNCYLFQALLLPAIVKKQAVSENSENNRLTTSYEPL